MKTPLRIVIFQFALLPLSALAQPAAISNASETGSAKDQKFRPLKFEFGIGVAQSYEVETYNDLILYLQPSYRFSRALTLSFRAQMANIDRGSVQHCFSYTVNGQFYFTHTKVRPFAGVGGGLYHLPDTEYWSFGAGGMIHSITDVPTENRFGFYPQLGVETGPVKLSVEYEFIPKTGIRYEKVKIRNDYLGITLSAFILAGPRR